MCKFSESVPGIQHLHIATPNPPQIHHLYMYFLRGREEFEMLLLMVQESSVHHLIWQIVFFLQDFIHLRWLAGFLPSTVCQQIYIYRLSVQLL